MELDEYLRKQKMRNLEFSKILEVHPTLTSRWRTGAVMPCAEYIEKIRKFTRGKVKLEDFIAAREKRKQRDAEQRDKISRSEEKSATTAAPL